MKTTVTFPETVNISFKTRRLRLGRAARAGAALGVVLIFAVSASAARMVLARSPSPGTDGGWHAPVVAVDPPCGPLDGTSIDHLEQIGDWRASWGNGAISATLTVVPGLHGQALQLNYNLGTARGAGVQLRRDFYPALDLSRGDHLRFYHRGAKTNTLESGLTSAGENYFGSPLTNATHAPWWTYATWSFQDFLKDDVQPLSGFDHIGAIFISVSNKQPGDVGGIGSLTVDDLQYLRVATRTVPSDFEPVTVPQAVVQKTADWIVARQQPSGLLQSWQEDTEDYAWLYDQTLGLIALSETNLPKAGLLADALHIVQNPDGSWYDGYHHTNLEPASTEKRVGANSWAVYALWTYYLRSGNQTAREDALEGAAWLAMLQRPDGSLPGSAISPDPRAPTEPNLAAWWAFQAVGYRGRAYSLKTYLTTQVWDSSMGRFNSDGANYSSRRYEILLDNQTWGAAFLHAIGRDADARRALSYARWTLAVDPLKHDVCGFGGSGPFSVWNEGTLQYVVAHGANSQFYVNQMIAQHAADGGLPGSPDNFTGYKEWLTRMHGVAPTAWLYFAGTGGPFQRTQDVFLPTILR